MDRLLFGMTALALVALATPADALSSCRLTTSPALVSATLNGDGAYIAKDPCTTNCPFATYVYVESNGVPGLQRMDDRHDDTCGGAYLSDTQIY